MRKQIVENVRAAVKARAGHPAIFGYLVGNEISSTMARWLGTRRVIEFVEELIQIGRAIDPDALFSYATYPPTEYLLPQNVDFCCFNVYLHDQRDFEKYLLRLQNLAEEKPLMLGEFGMDTIRHPEEEQAEMLSWHVDSVVRCGLAGTIFFAWTDEWYTGEEEITDWSFGLVRRDRTPKKSFCSLQKKLGQDDASLPHRDLPRPGPARRNPHPAIPHHHRRHPVPRRWRHPPVPADLRVVMRVRIDEPRRHHQPIRVDRPARTPGQRANLHDLPAHDPDIRAPRRRARAVDHRTALDEDVVGHDEITPE